MCLRGEGRLRRALLPPDAAAVPPPPPPHEGLRPLFVLGTRACVLSLRAADVKRNAASAALPPFAELGGGIKAGRLPPAAAPRVFATESRTADRGE